MSGLKFTFTRIGKTSFILDLNNFVPSMFTKICMAFVLYSSMLTQDCKPCCIPKYAHFPYVPLNVTILRIVYFEELMHKSAFNDFGKLGRVKVSIIRCFPNMKQLVISSK